MPMLARIKKVPWGVLSLEFVVVVLGILGALAVDSWWTDRDERLAETEYLIRLHRDLARNRESLLINLTQHKTAAAGIRAAMEELRTDPDPEGIELVVEGLRQADALDVWFPHHTTYEELVSTGHLALLVSDTLRQALGEYDREVRDNLDWDQWLEDVHLTLITPGLYKHVNPSDIMRADLGDRAVLPTPFEMDVPALYGNREIWIVLQVKLDNEIGVSGGRESLLEVLQIVLSLTEAELRSRGVPIG